MPAYVILDIEITDPKGDEDYKRLAPPTVGRMEGVTWPAAGRPRCWRGMDVEPVGDPRVPRSCSRPAVAQFAEYRPARSQRHQTAKTKMVVVEGVVPG